MGRFTVRLDMPDLAWNLLATLEPMLRSARDVTQYGIEIVDAAGTLEAASAMQGKAATAGREHAPARITATVRGGAGAGEYSISIWVSGTDASYGASVNGHAVAGGPESGEYAEELLREIHAQVRGFLESNYLPAGDNLPRGIQQPAGNGTTALEGAFPANRGRLKHLLVEQLLVVQIIGGTIAAVIIWFVTR